MTPKRVLVIEDDEELQGALRLTFERGGIETLVRKTGRGGLRALHEHRPDVVILDIGLPDIPGWDVLERIRDVSEVPVLLLTARSLEMEKVRGLQEGADDYLTKPFGNAELLARVQALIRRGQSERVDEAVLSDDRSGLRMDVATRRVTVGGDAVDLTPLEWRLLRALLEHRGQVLSPPQLLEMAWGDPLGENTGRVKFTIRRLRGKLGSAGELIETVRGFGYRI